MGNICKVGCASDMGCQGKCVVPSGFLMPRIPSWLGTT